MTVKKLIFKTYTKTDFYNIIWVKLGDIVLISGQVASLLNNKRK